MFLTDDEWIWLASSRLLDSAGNWLDNSLKSIPDNSESVSQSDKSLTNKVT